MSRGLLVVALFTSLLALPPASPVTAAGTVGDGSPGSCTEAALNSALAGGGLVTFNCHPDDLPIVLTSHKTIATDTQIDGGGVVTLAGDGDNRLFDVNFGITLRLAGITLTNGTTDHNGAGAIRNSGVLEIIDSTLSGNATFGVGGAINNSGGTMTVINSTFSGNSADSGAGIYNSGSLTVIDSTFSGNTAHLSGGGIVVQHGSLEMTDSIVSGNMATAFDGGGICISSSTATATVTNTTISDNAAGRTGGGVYVNQGSVTVTNTTLQDNSADDGGGIYLSDNTFDDGGCTLSGPGGPPSNSSNATVINSTLSDNSADVGGGAIHLAAGMATVTNSTLSDNSADFGGGIYNDGTLIVTKGAISGNTAEGAGGGISNIGAMTVTDSTISGNSSGGGVIVPTVGGGISNSGAATMTNSTISGNSTGDAGGGIYSGAGTFEITNSTISNNSAVAEGGGIYTSSPVSLQNTIVANSEGGDNCAGPNAVTSLGGNLSDDATCALTGPGDLDDVDDGLGPLADNGGPTLTHRPEVGSPAIDNATCSVDADQRGISRPQGAGCDIGSVEVRSATYLLCVNRYTGQVTSPAAGNCPPTTIEVTPIDVTFCIDRYTGQLSFAFGRPCATGRITHALPGDGDLLTCISRYTRANRWVTSHARCTSAEVANTIPAQP